MSTLTLRAWVRRSRQCVALALLGLASCGGGGETPQGPAAEPHAASEGDEQPTEGDGHCDPSSVTLVGRFSLTRYPGQDALGPNGERPLGMSKEYEFAADSYTMEGYPPLRITGRYEVLERAGLRLHVRFFDTVFDGTAEGERTLWLSFEECGDILQMDGLTYARRAASE